MFENFNQLANKKDKKKLFILFVLLLFGTLIEMIGIGSIPLFAIAIVEPDRILNNLPHFINFDFIKSINNKQLTLYVSILILIVFLFKNIYLTFINFFSGLVIKRIRLNTYNRLFYSYLKSSYEFHINRNSADLIRNMTSEVSKSVSYIISSILLVKEFLIIFTILIGLIFIDYKISFLIFLLLGLFTMIFFFISRKSSKIRGILIQQYWAKQIKTISQGIGSIKETKILNKENFVYNIFKNNTSIIERYNFIQGFVVTLPRLFLELMAILVIVIISLTFVLTDRSFENFIPLIALITAASIRLIPSFNTISTSVATIRHFSPSFELIANELKNMNEMILAQKEKKINDLKKNFSFKEKIILENLTYFYPGTKKKIIDSVSLKINFKDIIGIVGSSGEGKSTLIDLIVGLLKPSSGKILVDNKNINKNSTAWQKQIGYVPQEIYLLDDTIKSNIAFGVKDEDFNEINYKNAIKLSQLGKFIHSLPKKEDTIVGDRGIRLSGGQRQRIGIARSLYNKPNILIFDEPTSSLDRDNEKKIMEDLNKLNDNLTIIIISHRLSVFGKCNKIFEVKSGKIIKLKKKFNF